MLNVNQPSPYMIVAVYLVYVMWAVWYSNTLETLHVVVLVALLQVSMFKASGSLILFGLFCVALHDA